MSNHSPENNSEMFRHMQQSADASERIEKLKKSLEANIFAGATGNFPQGKLTKSDEGEIQFMVGAKNDKVILQFGTPVARMGMTPEQAVDLGEMLIQKAAIVGHVRPIKVTV